MVSFFAVLWLAVLRIFMAAFFRFWKMEGRLRDEALYAGHRGRGHWLCRPRH